MLLIEERRFWMLCVMYSAISAANNKLSCFFQEKLKSGSKYNRRNPNPLQTVEKFFSTVPKSVIRKLYEIYHLDFKMFDYGTPDKYIAMGC